MKHSNIKSSIITLGLIISLGIVTSCQNSSTSNKAETSDVNIDSLKKIGLELAAANDSISSHLKTFDELDFDVFSNQKWDRLKESHSKDIKVFWPDGHVAKGIETHIEDLKKLFVHAPD